MSNEYCGVIIVHPDKKLGSWPAAGPGGWGRHPWMQQLTVPDILTIAEGARESDSEGINMIFCQDCI